VKVLTNLLHGLRVKKIPKIGLVFAPPCTYNEDLTRNKAAADIRLWPGLLSYAVVHHHITRKRKNTHKSDK